MMKSYQKSFLFAYRHLVIIVKIQSFKFNYEYSIFFVSFCFVILTLADLLILFFHCCFASMLVGCVCQYRDDRLLKILFGKKLLFLLILLLRNRNKNSLIHFVNYVCLKLIFYQRKK